MRATLTIPWIVVAASAALSAGPAHAQPPQQAAPLSAEAAARADELFKAGNNDVRQQKWVEAEAKFIAAFELNRSYDIAANLGHTQFRLGKHREAAEHLQFALRSWPITGEKERRELAAKRLAELRKLLASVTIRVSVPGATVFVDGKEVGRSPLADEVFLEPGPRTIEAKLAGYADAKQAIDATKGSSPEVTLAMQAAAPTSRSGGGVTGGTVRQEPSGARLGAGSSEEGNAGAPGGGGASSGPNMALGIGGLSVTGLGLVAGIVFAAVSNARSDEARELRSQLVRDGGPRPCLMPALAERCGDVDSAFKARDAFGDAAVWSFIGTGIAGASTVIYVLVTPKSRVQAAPVMGPRAGGLVVSGAW
jgi:tetratricopeptide (TPR) repeat protein